MSRLVPTSSWRLNAKTMSSYTGTGGKATGRRGAVPASENVSTNLDSAAQKYPEIASEAGQGPDGKKKIWTIPDLNR